MSERIEPLLRHAKEYIERYDSMMTIGWGDDAAYSFAKAYVALVERVEAERRGVIDLADAFPWATSQEQANLCISAILDFAHGKALAAAADADCNCPRDGDMRRTGVRIEPLDPCPVHFGAV